MRYSCADSIPATETPSQSSVFCIEYDIQTYIRLQIGNILASRTIQLNLMNMPVLHCARNSNSYRYRLAKHILDILISGFAWS